MRRFSGEYSCATRCRTRRLWPVRSGLAASVRPGSIRNRWRLRKGRWTLREHLALCAASSGVGRSRRDYGCNRGTHPRSHRVRAQKPHPTRYVAARAERDGGHQTAICGHSSAIILERWPEQQQPVPCRRRRTLRSVRPRRRRLPSRPLAVSVRRSRQRDRLSPRDQKHRGCCWRPDTDPQRSRSYLPRPLQRRLASRHRAIREGRGHTVEARHR